ncbi:MAG TPA: hypothetical protein VFL83_06640 [Anaeromyxobacter sp.]|nr:hypothetical protein [Anaeromyxobacter sp.]
MSRAWRRAAAAAALAAAVPALAYVLPVPGILRRMGERRAALALASLEVTGTLVAEGDAAERLAGAVGQRPAGAATSVPARLAVKVPGRCRLELAPAGVAEGARPYVAVRDGKVAASGGLDAVPGALALVRGACTLLGVATGGDASGAYAAALSRRGVPLADASLGRFDGHIAYVIGARAAEAKPRLFVGKDTFQPLRLLAEEGGALRDLRLLGWGSPTGGDWFPRAAEVWNGDRAELRFTTERAAANPRLAELLFP